jgi:chemotaxis protein methyltransferase CheR
MSAETRRFRSAIGVRFGLRFEDAKSGFLGEVLRRRLKERGEDSHAYLSGLECDLPDDEMVALAGELTVGETYFFRNIEQFRALGEIVIPDRLKTAGAARPLRFLSAGCSSGEEAYSIAIVARQAIPAVSIRAIDINAAALERAGRARYSAWALRETPDDVRDRWFVADKGEIVLAETIRTMVAFERANLVADDARIWPSDHYDAIFCRNVLMYFEPQKMRAVIERIAASLAPGGYLFLGHAETLRGVSDAFDLCKSDGTFYYRRKDGGGVPRDATPCIASSASFPALIPQTAWFDEIRQASERVAALLPAPCPEMAVEDSADAAERGRVLDLVRQERFAEALDLVRRNPAGRSADALLLEAALLAHSNLWTGAAEIATRLLAVDDRNAGAHYLLALCGEHARQPDRAIAHHRMAIRFDPSFAMPRLHLGLLLRRAGELRAAEGELSQALRLLSTEDASRLLLFGGGFGREALTSVCEAALAASGRGA